MRRNAIPLILLLAICATPSQASEEQVTRYRVKLTIDFLRQALRGEETIEFDADGQTRVWQKQPGLRISSLDFADGQANSEDRTLTVRPLTRGPQHVRLQYNAKAARGFRFLENQAGIVTAFYCDAWMVCDTSPGQRAALALEIVLPTESHLTAVGPGQLTRRWQDKEGEHFAFEQTSPVQTYLFSFAAAKLDSTQEGQFVIYANNNNHRRALDRTKAVYAFLRRKATVDTMTSTYNQAFLPTRIAQESASLALMSGDYLNRLEAEDDVSLLAHELAHQWWGALVGIRSWSDFWLNEGMAEFMSNAYLEEAKGKAAYERQIAELAKEFDDLRKQGQDRPLHWEGWKDAQEALGRIPYVKGALFLSALRVEVGDDKFWKGIGLYTSRNANHLVDSRDFEKVMEEAAGRDLKAVFAPGVYQ
jgi:aminopeptidase N